MKNIKRGEFLRRARENKKLTQEELGNLVFYSDKTISAWEKGVYTPSDYETIIRLSEVLEISPLDIIYGEENISTNEQVFSLLSLKRKNSIKALIIIILSLITIMVMILSFYFTNLKDNTKLYRVLSSSDEILTENSYYIANKNHDILAINKFTSPNNKYYIKNIFIYYLENNKKVKIISGSNQSYLLNNNKNNEYKIHNLYNKKIYVTLYLDKDEITIPLYLNNKKEDKEEIINNTNSTINIFLKKEGFNYVDGECILSKNNITITYNTNKLTVIKENDNNNEYLNKKINNNNIYYKKMTSNGKYIEKELNIKTKSKCDLDNKTSINELAECLNYLSDKLK